MAVPTPQIAALAVVFCLLPQTLAEYSVQDETSLLQGLVQSFSNASLQPMIGIEGPRPRPKRKAGGYGGSPRPGELVKCRVQADTIFAAGEKTLGVSKNAVFPWFRVAAKITDSDVRFIPKDSARYKGRVRLHAGTGCRIDAKRRVLYSTQRTFSREGPLVRILPGGDCTLTPQALRLQARFATSRRDKLAVVVKGRPVLTMDVAEGLCSESGQTEESIWTSRGGDVLALAEKVGGFKETRTGIFFPGEVACDPRRKALTLSDGGPGSALPLTFDDDCNLEEDANDDSVFNILRGERKECVAVLNKRTKEILPYGLTRKVELDAVKKKIQFA